jgi:NAD(P)-dependent dehydrogenase (short-subunit alcohol dehydrogenase family)
MGDRISRSSHGPKLTGMRSVVVTGGTGGLGVAVTSALLAEGWQVVVPWVSERELTRLPEHERLTTIHADLLDPAAVATVAAAAAEPLRAVVNLVGGFAMGGRVHETPVEAFEEQLRLNLRPAYLMCQATIPRLIAAGGGSLICVSSQSAKRPFAGAAGYLTAKTAVLGLVDALHAEYAGDGIRVNAILPGVIDTPANRASQPDSDRKGWTAPEDIAQSIAFLCDDRSAAVRGSHIAV